MLTAQIQRRKWNGAKYWRPVTLRLVNGYYLVTQGERLVATLSPALLRKLWDEGYFKDVVYENPGSPR